MTAMPMAMPACLAPCPLRTSYRGTLPLLEYCLHWTVREDKDGEGENKVKRKVGCAMTTMSMTVTLPACLAPCPLWTIYRGALPLLICNLYCRVCEYEDSVGKNIVKWKAGCAMTTMPTTMSAYLAPCPLRTSYRGALPLLVWE